MANATFSLLNAKQSLTLTNPLKTSHSNKRQKRLSFKVKSCHNLPLKPNSCAGKTLSSVLQNQPNSFYDAVFDELARVGDDRDAAFARSRLSFGSPEATLHRRIAELKEAESQLAVEDVLYMIILYRFSEIRVPMIPSLSKCLYNGRLEILPSKDWELESIYSLEVLEMVREHLSDVLGWKASSSVTVNWSTTKIQRLQLSQVYAASISFGYFLKSASNRFCLEQNLPHTFLTMPLGNWSPSFATGVCGLEKTVVGQTITPNSTTLSQLPSTIGQKDTNFRCYVAGFDLQTRQVCSEFKSEEAVGLIKKHCSALFASDMVDINEKDEILTSLSSLKRLVLEAVAFGGFLWDAEHCVSSTYKLKERF